jgi:hypothetical protein
MAVGQMVRKRPLSPDESVSNRRSPKPLVPAEAGTQLLQGKPGLFSCRWIPAFAGMSGYNLISFSAVQQRVRAGR